MANDKIVKNENKETKLAPIFVIKSKEKSVNKLKRKNKSFKCENNSKVIKKCDNNIQENSVSLECRRSKRLKDKVFEDEKVVNYNEVIIEENTENYWTENKTINHLNNDSIFVNLIEENSNTIDYWSNNKCVKQLDQNEDIDEIEVVYSQTSNSSTQQSVKTYLASIQSIDGQKESLLWTEKYKPNNSSEVIGHKIAVNKLKSWLEDWNNSDNRVEANSDESYDCFDASNTCLLICGPTGSGKTSLVYAIAEELKYEVLELNASIRRNGRIISKIVGEATQSHHMQRTNDSQSGQSIQSMFSTLSQKKDHFITDSEVKVERVVKPLKKSKNSSKNKGILNYFTKQNTTKSVKSTSAAKELEIIECEKDTEVSVKCEAVIKVSNDSVIPSPKVLSITSNSLILIDDVDVMIDEDFNSFWSAVNKINDITKKPVILTATQFIPYIKDCVNRLQVLTLNVPDHYEIVNALKNICDKEIDCEEEEINVNVCEHLSNTYNHDIRRCINELQFGWNQWKHFQTQADQVIQDDSYPISYYDSLVFSDVMETKFHILNDFQNRELWMECKPTLIEDDNQNICLAKDIINTMNELNNKINNIKSDVIFKSNELLPIESECIDSISQFLTKNTCLRTILLDYCPYLSFICQSESIRQLETANHSRKSRRFMHHLDSIGFYIGNGVKNKLISCFISQLQSHVSNENSEKVNQTIDLIDSDFYD